MNYLVCLVIVKLSKEQQIAWAAGIIEGEGCITLHSGHPYLLIDMTDKDVIDRMLEIFPIGTVRGPYTHKARPQYKPRWRFDAFGTKAIPIISEIYPYLLSRRKAKVDEILSQYENKKTK